jgi:hypothetical protein
MRRWLDRVLVVLLVIGGWLAFRSAIESDRLQAEYEDLRREIPELEVAHPSRLTLRAMPTGDPMHFAWRIQIPSSFPFVLASGGGVGTSTHASPRDIIHRVRFRAEPGGRLQVYSGSTGGSSVQSIGDEALGRFLAEHWSELLVEQLGVDRQPTLQADQHATLLRISLPEPLRRQAVAALPQWAGTPLLTDFYKIEIGQKPQSNGPPTAESPRP